MVKGKTDNTMTHSKNQPEMYPTHNKSTTTITDSNKKDKQ